MTESSKPQKEPLVLRRPPGTKSMSSRTRPSKAAPPAPAPESAKEESPPPALDDQPARIPAGLPKIYADLASDVVYGLHTTKIVLAEETGSNKVRPVAVVTIPTATLLLLAKAVVTDLTSPGMVKETVERYAGVLEVMQNTKVD